MAGHAQLKFVMTECSKTQIRLTELKSGVCYRESKHDVTDVVAAAFNGLFLLLGNKFYVENFYLYATFRFADR